ncbi:MAG: hypothetical protein JO274_09970 [Gammaproteobacteria bacterium]|nr:hypothetical protein [Gammaproteobacteria bacterium]
MRPALLALLLAAAAMPAVQARDALQAIDDCLPRLDSDLDVGYARISARCPDLAAALSASAFAPWLPADWSRPDNELSSAGLSELRAQLARESSPGANAGPAPRSERVGAVLAAVARSEEHAGRSWWQRFKDWLSGLVSARQHGGEGWLTRWLPQLQLSTGTAEVIGWAAVALVVVLAAGIVLNELRIAGVFTRRRDRLRTETAAASRYASSLDLAAIGQATPEEQPALLLELIAARLTRQQRLPPARALTARELEQSAHLPQQRARAPFLELVAVSERVRFSAARVSGPRLAAALAGGRLLLEMLDAPAPDVPEPG